MGSEPFDIQAGHEDGRLRIRPTGELDIATVGRVRDTLAERRSDEGVVLDLSGLSFLDTSGLQLVVEVQRQAAEQGFELRLVRGTPHVQRVFEIAGLDGVLPFEDAA